MSPPPERAPLIAHVVDYFEAGGLENGLANLLNEMPHDAYRHVVVCLRGYTSFRERVRREDVQFVTVGKRPGADPGWYARLWRMMRRLRPAIVHTRNLGTLEAQAVAAVACGAVRLHGEHGRDVWDLDGSSRKYNLLRKTLRPCVDHYIAVSADLERWLTQVVNVPPGRITRIHNGVDARRFSAAAESGGEVARGRTTFVVGTVGRLAEVKDPLTLTAAFLHLLRAEPDLRGRLRLTIAGDGPLHERCLDLVREAGVAELCTMPGRRNDVADVLRSLDLFVLPSIAEGSSNTILEAMATGLPVVATAVGGNPELVVDGTTGTLVPPSDPVRLAQAIRAYIDQPCLRHQHGQAGRQRVEAEFSLAAMVDSYLGVYGRLMNGRRASAPAGRLGPSGRG
jgi:sugar transferase (PEP-CTERM/EpsH1 system associated)